MIQKIVKGRSSYEIFVASVKRTLEIDLHVVEPFIKRIEIEGDFKMNVSHITFKSNKDKNYYVEACPDGLGIRFIEGVPGSGGRCIALIADGGNRFFYTARSENGLVVTKFWPSVQLLLKNGEEAPVDFDGYQIETKTKAGKIIVVRPLCRGKENGVVIAYYEPDEEILWSIAMVAAPQDRLLVSLAE